MLERTKDRDWLVGLLATAKAQNKPPSHYRAQLEKIKNLDTRRTAKKGQYLTPPMSPTDFLTHGIAKHQTLWPAVLPHYEELCSGKYVEAVLTGGIGTAKTTLAVFVQAYETYRILNLTNPHAEFGLDPDSEIVIVFQSVTAGAARAVDYDFFRGIIDGGPWFRDEQIANYESDLKSLLRFERGLTVKPVSSLETAAIGQNVIGGVIDELNFLAIVDDSRRSYDGSAYDQAQVNYNAIARRRESRFMQKGWLPGMLCLVSSKRYPGQFTDRKVDQANKERAVHGKSGIYVYDKRVWEVRPEGSYSGEKFKVFVGERTRNPYVVPKADYKTWPDDDPMIDDVPVEYLHSYEEDIHAALRDISGLSTMLQHAYFTNMERLGAAFKKHKNIFNTETTDFVKPILKIRPKLFIDPKKKHYAHVDLGATADSAGICIGHVDKFVDVQRTNGSIEQLPLIVIDGLLEVPPPPGGEIDFAKIRSVFYRLRELGMNLLWISYDSWQSRDSLQILKNQGFTVGVTSLDRDTKGYDLLKRAILDGRVHCPTHAKTEEELRLLQWIRDKDKIDHLPKGSKDCSDALAGVVHGLTMRREIWMDANIFPSALVVAEKEPKENETV